MPVKTKAAGQPNVTVTQGTTAGATTAPMLAPELKMPVARALSLLGNHSATVFMAEGKFPASARPKEALATPNPKADRASAWPLAATLQRTIEIE